MRNHRKNQPGKEHLQAYLKTKKGMRMLNSDGPITEFMKRESGRGRADDLWAWKKLMGKSQNHGEHQHRNPADIVAKLNENARVEKEMERIRKEKKEAGE